MIIKKENKTDYLLSTFNDKIIENIENWFNFINIILNKNKIIFNYKNI